LQTPIYKKGKGPGETLQPEILRIDRFELNADEYNSMRKKIKEDGANSFTTEKFVDELIVKAKVRAAEKAAKAAQEAAQKVKEQERRVNVANIISGDDGNKADKGESYDISQKGAGLESSLKGSPTPGGTGGKVRKDTAGSGVGRQDYSGGNPFRAKGGLMEAPKPKVKKMKRGGLASKK
jgi:hypothetical protein